MEGNEDIYLPHQLVRTCAHGEEPVTRSVATEGKDYVLNLGWVQSGVVSDEVVCLSGRGLCAALKVVVKDRDKVNQELK